MHASEGVGVEGEEVGPIGKCGEEGALRNAVAKKRSDASTGGGYSFHERKGSQGQQNPVLEVVDCSHGGGQPIAEQSHDPRGVKELAVQFSLGSCMLGSLAGSSPVHEFGLWDREVSAKCKNNFWSTKGGYGPPGRPGPP